LDKPSDRDRENQALRERLSRMIEASLRINESLEFDTVLQGVLDSARDLTRARYGAIILLDDDGRAEDVLSSGLTPERRSVCGTCPTRSGSSSDWAGFPDSSGCPTFQAGSDRRGLPNRACPCPPVLSIFPNSVSSVDWGLRKGTNAMLDEIKSKR